MRIKTIFRILPVAALVLAFSCKKIEVSIDDTTPKYIGTMTVTSDGEQFTNDNIAVQFAVDPSGNTVDIKMLKVKFVPAMPVRIDVTIPDVPILPDGTFSGDNIIPYALGGRPYSKYTVYGLTGRKDGDTLSFSLRFGEYPTTYSGRM